MNPKTMDNHIAQAKLKRNAEAWDTAHPQHTSKPHKAAKIYAVRHYKAIATTLAQRYIVDGDMPISSFAMLALEFSLAFEADNPKYNRYTWREFLCDAAKLKPNQAERLYIEKVIPAEKKPKAKRTKLVNNQLIKA